MPGEVQLITFCLISLKFESQNLLQLLTEMAPVSCVVLPMKVSKKRRVFYKDYQK